MHQLLRIAAEWPKEGYHFVNELNEWISKWEYKYKNLLREIVDWTLQNFLFFDARVLEKTTTNRRLWRYIGIFFLF